MTPGKPDSWSLYMVRCRDGSLYTGIATDVSRRLAEHSGSEGRGARYLRGRGPLKLVMERPVGSMSLALRLEARVKRLPRSHKEELIQRGDILERLIEACAGDRPARSTRTSHSGC